MESRLSRCYISLRCGMRVGSEGGRRASEGCPARKTSFGESSTQLEFNRFDDSTYLRGGSFEIGDVVLLHPLEPLVHEVQKLPVCGDGIVVERCGTLAEYQITEMHEEIRTKEVQYDAPLELYRTLRIRIGLLVDPCELRTQAVVRNET